jgi:hypothetical protein
VRPRDRFLASGGVAPWPEFRAALMFAPAVGLFDDPTPKAAHAFVADRLFMQRQGVDHLPQRPSILLGPFAANDAVVFGCHGQLIHCATQSHGAVVAREG